MVLGCFVLIEMWVFQLDVIIKKFQDQIMHILKNGSGKHQKTQQKSSLWGLGKVCIGNASLGFWVSNL